MMKSSNRQECYKTKPKCKICISQTVLEMSLSSQKSTQQFHSRSSRSGEYFAKVEILLSWHFDSTCYHSFFIYSIEDVFLHSFFIVYATVFAEFREKIWRVLYIQFISALFLLGGIWFDFIFKENKNNLFGFLIFFNKFMRHKKCKYEGV